MLTASPELSSDVDPGRVGIPTHCPYCAFQCGVHLTATEGKLAVSGNAGFPVNKGALCVKGWTAAATLAHPERLRTPLARQNGELVPVSWDEALGRIADGIRLTQARHGPDARRRLRRRIPHQ